MAKNVGTLITAAIRPNDSNDPIASAYSSEIKGGLHSVDDLSGMNNIIVERRDWGMLCYVIDSDKTYQLKYNYVSTDIEDNSNWVEFSSGSQNINNEWLDSVITITYSPPGTYSTGDRYLAGVDSSLTLSGDWALYDGGVVLEWNENIWEVTLPTEGMSVRVDDEDNSIYKYEGNYPSGIWNKELLGQVRSIDPITSDGFMYTSTTEPNFDGYVRDMMFLTKFDSPNLGTTASININSLGWIDIKKPTSSGLSDLSINDIVPNVVYTLVYDGTYFQLMKHYQDDNVLNIKYLIESDDYIVVPPYYQYWVYGDLTIEGTLVNYGQVVIGNGSMIVNGGTFSNYGDLFLVNLALGDISFNDSDTIDFTVESVNQGLSVSAVVKDDSLLPTNLNTSLNGGATAGYVLSSSDDGYFKWIESSGQKLTVVDGTPGQGLTISDVTNMVFIGGSVKVPIVGGNDVSMGVQVLPGGQEYQPGTALIYIPRAPMAIYASYFNTDTQPVTNTNGIVSRTLNIENVRISSPTSEGNPFSIGDWSILPSDSSFPATIEDEPYFETAEEVTGFSATSSGDSTLTIELIDGDGITSIYEYTTPVIYENDTFTDLDGSDVLVEVVIINYGIDDSELPELYLPKWKAKPQITINTRNIFNSIGREGGRYQVKITHNLDSDTNYESADNTFYLSDAVFHDFNPNTPSIEGTTSFSETDSVNITTRFISGIQYYTTGSEFNIQVTDITNLNRNTQGVSGSIDYNFRIKSLNFGLPGSEGSTNINYNLRSWDTLQGDFVSWSNDYDLSPIDFNISDWIITSTSYRYRGSSGQIESQVYDPWGSSITSQSPTQSILVDCDQTASTDLIERFNIENKRLERLSTTYSNWNYEDLLDTTNTATNGTLGTPSVPYVDALFMGGSLVSANKFTLTDPLGVIQTDLSDFKPDKNTSNPDYSTLTGTSVFHRRFYTSNESAISSFYMTLSGYFGSVNNLEDALTNSRLKIYIRKIDSALSQHQSGPESAPLALHGDLYRSGDFNDGLDPISGLESIDTQYSFIRVGVSGNTTQGTFGGFDAKYGMWIEVQLVDNTIRLDNISVSFNQ